MLLPSIAIPFFSSQDLHPSIIEGVLFSLELSFFFLQASGNGNKLLSKLFLILNVFRDVEIFGFRAILLLYRGEVVVILGIVWIFRVALVLRPFLVL